MRFMWLDTETTGLETTDASAFELAFILVQNGVVICERDFYLNPLSETIKYNEDAGKIHGYTEEQIKAFPPEKEQVLKIVDFLQSSVNLFKLDGSRTEKLVIAGYNVEFDKKHLKALLARNGFNYDDYFIDTADVFEQVKRASIQKALPYLPDRKLGTVAKHLGVNLENAHNALADIRATREVAKKLQQLNVNLL